MSLRSLEACIFVDEPPEIEFRDGLFHIIQMVGDWRFERVMRPSVFVQGIVKAIDASKKLRIGKSAEIIVFDFDSRFERVFPKDKTA